MTKYKKNQIVIKRKMQTVKKKLKKLGCNFLFNSTKPKKSNFDKTLKIFFCKTQTLKFEHNFKFKF